MTNEIVHEIFKGKFTAAGSVWAGDSGLWGGDSGVFRAGDSGALWAGDSGLPVPRAAGRNPQIDENLDEIEISG